ncbi:diphthine--ammonia ligase [Tetranychus urticae]|nr:diphthine--ammonia ligase [Tetranychus urticae]
MRVVGLISGGKDSCYNLMQCVKNGHTLVGLLNLHPPANQPAGPADELDSYMYQTVGHQAIEFYSQAIDLPLFRHPILGKPINRGPDYPVEESGDEVEDLFIALSNLKRKLEFDAISVGAILSTYQKVRAENVCRRLDIDLLCYLWGRSQKELLQEMIQEGIHAVIIKTASMGLEPYKHLGLTLQQMYPVLVNLNSKYGMNICGEGGEYETLTLDCPLFKSRLVIEESQIVIHSDDAFAPVGYLKPVRISLEAKSN